MSQYCYNCLNPLPAEQAAVCPVCGYDNTGYTAEPHQLLPGTIINNRYLVGRVIGEGGFGITYVGKDTILDLKVAIKEFYMTGYVNRNNTATTIISLSTGQYQETFEKNREKFINEARVLAKFSDHDGVVGIRDYFKENNTAYIVMDYLDGPTLKDYLDEKGKLSWNETYRIMKPVLTSLAEIHKSNIIHRDISPDNIKLVNDGKVKLLDFGAAREISKKDIKSLSVILKPGYAPEEQYRSKGPQGPWTDVYALCATMYKCLTGTTPDDAMERMFEDNLVEPLEEGADVSPALSKVLTKGLAVRQKDRYQTIEELMRDISYAESHPDDVTFMTGEAAAAKTEAAAGDQRTVLADSLPGAGAAADDRRTVLADEYRTIDAAAAAVPQGRRPQNIPPQNQQAMPQRPQTAVIPRPNARPVPTGAVPAEQGPSARKGRAVQPAPAYGGAAVRPKKKSLIRKIWPVFILPAILIVIIALVLADRANKKPTGIPVLLDGMKVTINGAEVTVPTTFAAMEELGWVAVDQEGLDATVSPGSMHGGGFALTNGYGQITVGYANPTKSTLMLKQCPIVELYISSAFNANYMGVEMNSCELPGGFVLGETEPAALKKIYGAKPEKYAGNVWRYRSEDETRYYEFSEFSKVITVLEIRNTNCDDVIEADTYSEYEPEYNAKELNEATGGFLIRAECGEETILEIDGCMLLADFVKTGWEVEMAPEVIASHERERIYLRKDTLTTVVLWVSNPTNVARVTEYCFITGYQAKDLDITGKSEEEISQTIVLNGVTVATGMNPDEVREGFAGWTEDVIVEDRVFEFETSLEGDSKTAYSATVWFNDQGCRDFQIDMSYAAQKYFDR